MWVPVVKVVKKVRGRILVGEKRSRVCLGIVKSFLKSIGWE